jgi:glutathione S-transferase
MGLPYVIKPVNIGRGEQFTPEFLAISPNNRMPAIVDPVGPEGRPISVFESGAILQYLGRKTGRFYAADERARVEVDEWVFWQMGGLGPMAGQSNHFRNYSPSFLLDQRHSAYGANRYTNEVNRLYGVLDKRLAGREFIAGEYSIADMITWPWVASQSSAAIQLEAFPDLTAWKARVGTREPVQRALAVAKTIQPGVALNQSSKEAEAARKVLFGQRAR